MAQKYEIYYEIGWDDLSMQVKYERLTTLKNENSAIDFIRDANNVGRYGTMKIRKKTKEGTYVYDEQRSCWIGTGRQETI